MPAEMSARIDRVFGGKKTAGMRPAKISSIKGFPAIEARMKKNLNLRIRTLRILISLIFQTNAVVERDEDKINSEEILGHMVTTSIENLREGFTQLTPA